MTHKPPREVWVVLSSGVPIEVCEDHPYAAEAARCYLNPHIARYVHADAVERLLAALREGGVDPAKCWCIGRRHEGEHSGICAEVHAALAELDPPRQTK